ncbi:MAG: dephospho-CoA kinase [Bacteroidales bacterium]|nr:dephospho-CoA kinase [Bacteroidales bacterium]
MKRVGVTGGIGSGKSFVCSVFEHMGIPVYNADNRARELMKRSPQLRESLTALLGEKAYREDELNRSYLAQILFRDPAMREKINGLVHPEVFMDFQQWVQKNQGKHYVIQEAAIIFESGADRLLDRVINVYAPVRERIQRLMSRDNLEPEEIRKRMRSQITEKERRQRADYVLVNDGKRMLLPQIVRIHNDLLRN